MKSNRSTEIGLKAQTKLEWLEHTASLVSDGYDKYAIEASLQELLREKLSVGSDAKNGSRDKTISTLKRIWVKAPKETEDLHRRGVVLFSQLPRQEHIVLHWGMSIAAYPFVGVVATSVGRLLRLQGTASASQVQRRLKEKYGDRETVSRATRYVLRNFIEWGVLHDTSSRGVYIVQERQDVMKPEAIAWLIECILMIDGNGTLSLKAALESPALFPFKIASISSDLLEKFSQIQIIRHSLTEELVTLDDR